MRCMTMAVLLVTPVVALADPLPSCKPGAAETAIVDFVTRGADSAADEFVPEESQVVFDNDGTLWSEQPMYFQDLYALRRLNKKAAADPSILTREPMKAAVSGEINGVVAGDEKGLVDILNVSHTGMSVDGFKADARQWLTMGKHPASRFNDAEMTFQPMVEILVFLRDHGFRTYIARRIGPAGGRTSAAAFPQ